MTERPRNYTYDPPPGVPRSNSEAETHVVSILSARPLETVITLDREGFALLHHQSAVRDFYDDDEVRRIYYAEAERAAGRGDRRAPRVRVRPHGAAPGARRGRSCARRAAPAGDPRARGPHGEVRSAAGARLARRRGGGIAAWARAGDQPVAADPWPAARCAAGGVRRTLGGAGRSGAVGPGVSRPGRRDLRRDVQSRSIAGSTCRTCSRTRRCC